MNAFPEFTDDTLTLSVIGEGIVVDPLTGGITIRTEAMTFGVTGEGAVFDPATGLFTVPADALRTGFGAVITATSADGTATDGFRMVIAIAAAPEVITLPELLGTGVIGAEVTLDPGLWSGVPVPTLGFQWQRDGADIPGAVAAAYVPGPADDGTALSCVVTARNAAGTLAIATAPIDVRYPGPVLAPPLAFGTIPELVYGQDSGDQSVSTQAGFIGEGLIYTLDAAPAGVTVHAGSGLVIISTAAPIARAMITARASNSAGSATQSFAVTVRSTATVFDAAGKLDDLGFAFDTAAPAWTQDTGAGKLIPAATGRAHGLWSKIGEDGRYRCLARWAATETTGPDYAPFMLGARVARRDGNFTGVYVEAFRPASGTKRLRLQQYTGVGAETTLLASVTRTWAWTIWYWVEIEIDGGTVKARLYPEAGPIPDWQVQASATVMGAGGFGPGGASLQGMSPTILIKRLEFYPLEARIPSVPAAAGDADWALVQVTE